MAESKSNKNVTVPLNTAEVWTKNHREHLSDENGKNRVNSYLISRETLEMVLKLNTTKVRAYIGINENKQNTLIFVGAELEDATGIYRDVYGVEAQNFEGPNSEVVYDFSEPSPPGKADNTSVLN